MGLDRHPLQGRLRFQALRDDLELAGLARELGGRSMIDHPHPTMPAEAPSADTQLMTSGSVARYLSVSEATLSRWRRDGVGPTWINLNGIARYRRGDVELFLEGHRR